MLKAIFRPLTTPTDETYMEQKFTDASDPIPEGWTDDPKAIKPDGDWAELPNASDAILAQSQMQITKTANQLTKSQKEQAETLKELTKKEKRLQQLEEQQAQTMLEIAKLKGE
ncbi:MAG: hypothetical protein L0J76_00730 [Tetragenococcus halophilus]|nr:hypothetical protein [Tetragenococcus halophilus]